MTKWYKKGICFSCEGCGGCCSGEPGYVWINDDEIIAMATELSISRTEFLQKYTRRVQGKISLIEKQNYDCIFLENNGCTIYNARPIQCRTYPFWKSALISRIDFIDATKDCPGTDLDIHHSTKQRYTTEEIEKIAASSTL